MSLRSPLEMGKPARCRPSATLSSSSRRSGHEVDELGVNGRMPTSRCIILAGLDDQSRSVIDSCLPSHQLEITQVEDHTAVSHMAREISKGAVSCQ